MYGTSTCRIKAIKDTFPVHVYIVESLDGREIEGVFTEQELSLAG